MASLPNPSLDMQSLIEKYRSEMMSAYQRKTLADPAPVMTAVMETEEETPVIFPQESTDDVMETDAAVNADAPEDVDTEYSVQTEEEPAEAVFAPIEEAPLVTEGTTTGAAEEADEEAIPPLTMRISGPFAPVEESETRAADWPIVVHRMTADSDEEAPSAPASEIVYAVSASSADEEDECVSPSMLWPETVDAAVSVSVEETVDEGSADEECAPPPSLFRPADPALEPLLAAMAEGQASAQPATLQVRVTTANQTTPIGYARVTVTREGDNRETMQKFATTDSDGNTSPLIIPACFPPRPCSIEVTAVGYCRVRYDRVPLSGGRTVMQAVDLIPLPAGASADFEIVYDEWIP